MMRPWVLVCCLVPCVALAQGKTLKDKEEIKFNEIERGFTIGMAAGWAPLFNLPGNQISLDAGGRNMGCKRAGASLANEVVRIDVGADIGSRGDDPRSAVPLLVVTAMVQAAHAKAGTDYFGTGGMPTGPSGACLSTAPGSPSGDFAMLGAGLAAKVNIIGIADSQDVKRLWLYARAAGGANFYFPNTLVSGVDVLVQAGAGIEYYTRLRHFAIGLEAMFQMMVVTTTFGVTLTPTLRYSF